MIRMIPIGPIRGGKEKANTTVLSLSDGKRFPEIRPTAGPDTRPWLVL